MPHTEPIDEPIIDAIATQVGSVFPHVVSDRALLRKKSELTETFPVWALRAEDLFNRDDPLSKLARPTGDWHTQLRIGGKALGFALTSPVGPKPEDWRLGAIFESPIAALIDEAISWVDENVPDAPDPELDPVVRLLDLPNYRIIALWLVNPRRPADVVVARLPTNPRVLETGRLYPEAEFLAGVRGEEFVFGIRPNQT